MSAGKATNLNTVHPTYLKSPRQMIHRTTKSTNGAPSLALLSAWRFCQKQTRSCQKEDFGWLIKHKVSICKEHIPLKSLTQITETMSSNIRFVSWFSNNYFCCSPDTPRPGQTLHYAARASKILPRCQLIAWRLLNSEVESNESQKVTRPNKKRYLMIDSLKTHTDRKRNLRSHMLKADSTKH